MKTSICFQCKCQALCPTGQVQSREATVSAITGCSRFESKDKQTNADRLRAMTDEELARWIMSIEPAACPFRDDHGDDCHFTHCRDCWLEWLKQEATDADN